MNGVKPVNLSFDKVQPKDCDEEDLPPVVLLHGLTQTKERWKDMMPVLADNSKRVVYAVDTRNHGESEQSEFFDLNVLSMDLDHFFNTQGIKRAAIVGHSIGGVTAIDMALTMPDKVEKIVLEDISPKMPITDMCLLLAEMIREKIECLKLLPPAAEEEFVHRQLKECIYRTIPMISDADHEVLEKMRFPIRKTDTGFEYRGNLTAIWKAFQDPETLFHGHTGMSDGDALFVFGGCSTMRVGEDKDLILKHFPKAQFKCVGRAGHEVYPHNPQQFTTFLVDFLKRE